MKSFFAAVGILAVILGVVVWNYGFFYTEIKSGMIQLDRATAVDRAEAMLDKTCSQVDSLKEKSYQLKVKARVLELEANREEENLNKTKIAMEQLAQTIKAAGLAKPSEVGTLSDEQKQTKIVFAGKEGTALDAYNQLVKWHAEFEAKREVLEAKRSLIAKLNEQADQMVRKQGELYAIIEKLKLKLIQLQADCDIAKTNAKTAEMGATEVGVNVGDIGKVLDTIQGEIDEWNSRTDVANAEIGKATNGDVFSKPDVSSVSNSVSSLDSLFD